MQIGDRNGFFFTGVRREMLWKYILLVKERDIKERMWHQTSLFEFYSWN